MSNHIDIIYQKVGHIIMLEEDDWNRIVEYLRSHDLSVTEKSAQHSAQADESKRLGKKGAGLQTPRR